MLTIPDPNNEGATIDVYTAEELAAKATEVENTYKPQVTTLTEKLTDAEKRMAERAGEFAQFRKLSDDQVKELSVAQRTIYENSLLLQAEREKNAGADKQAYESAVGQAIRAKVGNDPKLIEKAREMYDLIGLEDVTPEQIQARAAAAVGALSQTQPDMVASLGFTNGSFEPPKAKEAGEQSYADTEAGKAAAKALGLTLEPPKQA